LIASPGDTPNERQIVHDVLIEWNGVNGEEGVMLLPRMWETDATPEMGDEPQAIINRQLVDKADMLIGIFWTRLGTPTSETESGTLEEIERCIKADKPVLLYFSSMPVVMDSVDIDQYERLVAARDDFKRRGLVDTFESEHELWRKVSAAVTRMVRDRFAPSLVVDEEAVESSSAPRPVLLARIDRQREIRGYSKSGSAQYTTRERLIIENQGTAAAANLTVDIEAPEGENEPFIALDEAPIGWLPPGGAVSYPMAQTFGTASQWDIVFRWTEGDVQHEGRQTMRG
jgi:hypothetical protein